MAVRALQTPTLQHSGSESTYSNQLPPTGGIWAECVWTQGEFQGTRCSLVFGVKDRGYWSIAAAGELCDDFREATWLHFVGNAAALSSLVNGSWSIREGDAIVGLTWAMLAGLGVIPCSDMVESSSSPVDRLSRGADVGPQVGGSLRFPRALLPAYWRVLA